jgi:hypothetical protein
MCASASTNTPPESLSINMLNVKVAKKSSYDEDFTKKLICNLPNGTVDAFGVTPNSVILRMT